MMDLGLEYDGAGQTDDAAAVLERAAQLAPQNSVVQGNLGALYLKLGRLADAEAHLRLALDAQPEDPVPWLGNLAAVCLRQGRPEEARAPLARALQLAPQDRHVQQLWQELQQRLGREHP
jgi:Flp pilus assembly protein TadD